MRYGFFIDIEAVGDEDEGESCIFRTFRDTQLMFEIRAGIGRYISTAPCVHMAAGPVEHDAELYFFTGHIIPAFSLL